MNPWLVALGLVGVIGAGYALSRGPRRTKSGTSPACPSFSSSGTVSGVPYVARSVGVASGVRAPLVVLLHGRGSSPSIILNAFDKISGPARIVALRGGVNLSGNAAWWEPRSVEVTATELAQLMRTAVNRVAPAIATMKRCWPVSSVIIVGHSQGGMLALALASLQPNLASKVVAASAWLPPELRNPQMTPTVLFHGYNDDTVPYNRTQDLAETLIAQGAPLSWNPIYAGHGFASFETPMTVAIV